MTAVLTAFYTFRAYFMTFWGELQVPPEAGSPRPHRTRRPPITTPPTSRPSAHESPPVMTVPLMILAVFAVGVGFVLGPTELVRAFPGADARLAR